MPPLDPYKPVGALDSVALRTLDPVLGISIDGIARDIWIYGFPNRRSQERKNPFGSKGGECYVRHWKSLNTFGEQGT